MRLYSFVNGRYLSGGQHGIQTGHAAVRIARMVDNFVATEWADKHQTFIILNAHNYTGLLDVTRQLSEFINMHNLLVDDDNLKLPYTAFFEDNDSLGGLQTCFACVLPENLYEGISKMDRDVAVQTVDSYWESVDQYRCMNHKLEDCRNLIMAKVKAYNLVQL